MPPKHEDFKLYYSLGGEEFAPIGDIQKMPELDADDEMIETSNLPEFPTGFGEQEVSVDFQDSGDGLKELLEPKHGEKIYYETSCVCDGTLYFAVQFVLALKKIGCMCINVRSETVNDANPPWMNCRFIVSGIMWNTNNWRRMHGVPMIRRKRK